MTRRSKHHFAKRRWGSIIYDERWPRSTLAEGWRDTYRLSYFPELFGNESLQRCAKFIQRQQVPRAPQQRHVSDEFFESLPATPVLGRPVSPWHKQRTGRLNWRVVYGGLQDVQYRPQFFNYARRDSIMTALNIDRTSFPAASVSDKLSAKLWQERRTLTFTKEEQRYGKR